MSILFISNIPSPYNLGYLEELGKLTKVIAIFERGASSERDESWKRINAVNFECIILSGMKIGVDMAYSPRIKAYIKKYRDYKIIIGNPASPTGMCAISYCKRKKIAYALQSEGGIPKNGKGVKEKFKSSLISGANLYLSGMSIRNDYFLHYGAPRERIKQYPFTSLEKKDILEKLPDPSEKEIIKKSLGINEERVIISVGRFIPVKGHDAFLEACRSLDSTIGIYLIGGEPTKELRGFVSENNMSTVHFIDFQEREKLNQYYKAADLFVLATRGDTWGLVINEAMANGLPIITTKKCVAGVELVENDVNGYLVDSDNIEQMRHSIETVIYDFDKCVRMGTESLKRIRRYSYEEMAATIYDALIEM